MVGALGPGLSLSCLGLGPVLIIPHSSPFTKIEYVTIFTHTMTRFINFSLKPIFLIISSRKHYSTRSYALLISNFNAMNPWVPDLYFCKLCKVSKATRILSEINLSLVKADWCPVMMDGSNIFRRLAKTLEKILYNTLHRLIWRNWWGC